jgi:hypothetical protein
MKLTKAMEAMLISADDYGRVDPHGAQWTTAQALREAGYLRDDPDGSLRRGRMGWLPVLAYPKGWDARAKILDERAAAAAWRARNTPEAQRARLLARLREVDPALAEREARR